MGADQLPLTLLPLNLAKSAPQAPGFSYGRVSRREQQRMSTRHFQELIYFSDESYFSDLQA